MTPTPDLQALIELLPACITDPDLCSQYEFVGSRITCDPPVLDTDLDVLCMLVDSRFAEVMWSLQTSGWTFDGSEYYANALDNNVGFRSYRNGELNLVLTTDPQFYRLFSAAYSVANRLNLLDKSDRIALFQAVIYGNAAEARHTAPTLPAASGGDLPTPFNYAIDGRPLFTENQIRAAIIVATSEDSLEARRWREVSDKAWFVDAAGYAYGLREGSFAPTCDADDVIAAIDATTPPAGARDAVTDEPAASGMGAALLRYGRHDSDCAVCHDSALKPKPTCTCGYASALAAQPAPVVQSPSYDALLIIMQSVSAAFERAGIADCDDPGEVIDILAADTKRIDWLESNMAHYGDGYTEPREAAISWPGWQQHAPKEPNFPGLRIALDAAMEIENESD